jgi:uncharacterized protein (DUF169 family)
MTEFATKELKFKHFKDNAKLYIAKKKASMKYADAILHAVTASIQKSNNTNKSIDDDAADLAKTMSVKVVINTTNVLDSHGDVHIQGLWKKSLKENRQIYLLQEHKMNFQNIISDEVKASADLFAWNDLGYPGLAGITEALVFNATIDAERNEYMFEQYSKGYVKNHSVGMQYITLFLCIDSDKPYYAEEKANWDKYISQVANKAEAVEQGMFWAVTEAKIIEGSAVVIGSNPYTPTIEVEEKEIEAEKITSTEPKEFTQSNKNKLIHLLN